MKYIKSTTTTKLEDLELTKTRIGVMGDMFEGIWVRKDHENQKMYLMNHSLNLHPFPSWGLELPLSNEVFLNEVPDLIEIGKNEDEKATVEFENSIFIVHPEAYEHLKEFLDEEGNFDIDSYYGEDESGENTADNDEEV